MRKLRPMKMKGLPNIHSKIRADPRIGPGCLGCQSRSLNKLHSMCYPSRSRPTHWTKSRYLLLLSWKKNNRYLEQQWAFDEHSRSASALDTTEENAAECYPGGKGLVRSLPCFPLHVIKMEAFRHAPIKKKKKSSVGAWDGIPWKNNCTLP